MDLFLAFSSFLISIVGIIGCILPALPGPPLAYAGVLLLHFSNKVEFTTTQLISWLLLVIVLQAIDYITPLLGNKYSGGTSAGNRGCIAGTILGLFFLPWPFPWSSYWRVDGWKRYVESPPFGFRFITWIHLRHSAENCMLLLSIVS